jgi:hypothetical protein
MHVFGGLIYGGGGGTQWTGDFALPCYSSVFQPMESVLLVEFSDSHSGTCDLKYKSSY